MLALIIYCIILPFVCVCVCVCVCSRGNMVKGIDLEIKLPDLDLGSAIY